MTYHRPSEPASSPDLRRLQRLFEVLLVSVSILSVGRDAEASAAATASSSSSSCPTACFCNAPSRIVYCSRRGLTAVPTGISSDTLQLNLNGNVFQSTTLRQGNFSGLRVLEHLYLSECGIERLEVGTFADLGQLRWLDLSNNRIKTLSDRTFYGLALQHLFLNGNRHVDLRPGSFDGLVTTGLYLHDCSLNRLTADVLGPLNSSLRYLWLNGNELTAVDGSLKTLFAGLSHLRLGSNPLHCNCETGWLKTMFDASPDTFRGAAAPSCLTPGRLRGRFFGDLAPTDFRCQAPAFSNIEMAFGAYAGGARLRCTATGDPAPTLYWIQPSGRTTRYPPPPDDDEAKRNEGLLTVEETPDDPSTSLYGMYICVANNEAGNVTLTVNVSWPFAGTSREAATTTTARTSTTATPFLVPVGGRPSGSGSDRSNSLVVLPTTTLGRRPVPGDADDSVVRRTNYTVLDVTAQMIGGGAPAGTDEESAGMSVRRTPHQHQQRLFTVSELVCAVIGTHLGTLTLCLVIVPIVYRRRRWLADRDKRRRAATVGRLQPPAYGTTSSGSGLIGGGGLEKQQPPLLPPQPTLLQYRQQTAPSPLPSTTAESVYLNGTPYSTVRRHPFLTDYLLTPPPPPPR